MMLMMLVMLMILVMMMLMMLVTICLFGKGCRHNVQLLTDALTTFLLSCLNQIFLPQLIFFCLKQLYLLKLEFVFVLIV